MSYNIQQICYCRYLPVTHRRIIRTQSDHHHPQLTPVSLLPIHHYVLCPHLMPSPHFLSPPTFQTSFLFPSPTFSIVMLQHVLLGSSCLFIITYCHGYCHATLSPSVRYDLMKWQQEISFFSSLRDKTSFPGHSKILGLLLGGQKKSPQYMGLIL